MDKKKCQKEHEKGVREKILGAATKIFSEKGYHGASMKEIADQAGVNKALLFYYFNSKENLHSELLKSIPEDLLRYLEEEAGEIEDCLTRFRGIIRGYIRHFSKSRHKMRIMLHSVLGYGPKPPLQFDELLHMSRNPLIEALECGISKGVFKDIDVVFAANGIIGFLQIFYRIPSNTGDIQYDDEYILKNVFEIIEKGILTGEKADEKD